MDIDVSVQIVTQWYNTMPSYIMDYYTVNLAYLYHVHNILSNVA